MGEDTHAAPAVEDTFVLSGQAYVLTEQDWASAPGAADAAMFETRNEYWKYMAGLLGNRVLHDGARRLGRQELEHRAMELAGGLFGLAPHASLVVPIARRAVASICIMHGLHIGHDLL